MDKEPHDNTVRGGLTSPRVFYPNGMLEAPLYSVADLYVCCSEHNNHCWSSDNAGYSLYWSGWDDEFDDNFIPLLNNYLTEEDKSNIIKDQMGVIKDLNKYDLYDPEYSATTDFITGDLIYAPYDEDWDEDAPEWRKGYMLVDEDGNGYCPLCGGKLEVYS